MSVINTNISATLASNALAKNERVMTNAMERLSTGMRINSAKDDAAGLAISARMAGQVRGLEQAARNANDAISMVQTVEGASKEIMNMLIRMRELAVQSASETYSSTDRTALQLEFAALRSEITRIQENTQWNGMAVMDGGTTKAIQVGPSASQTMSITFADWSVADALVYGTATAGSHAGATSTAISALTIATSATTAADAIHTLDIAINGVASEQATYGAYLSRLQFASDNLLNVAQNTDASRSRIADADYASETTELARTQIIAQAGTAMLAQANQIKQTVLSLLK
ncbi:MAG: flagellin [Proteobacteria bacterium]|nr:flagellin [Pseudomonadota bacterium]MDA0928075.1 flagellin [Pseudomonadota bacterium]